MRNRGFLKVRTIAYFIISGIIALGAPLLAKVLRGGIAELSGRLLAGFLALTLMAIVFLWAGLRALARLRASDSN